MEITKILIIIIIALTLGMISVFATLTAFASACSSYQIGCWNAEYERGQRFANSDSSHEWYMPPNESHINKVCMNKLFAEDPACAFVQAFNSGYNHVFGTDLADTSTSSSQDINK